MVEKNAKGLVQVFTGDGKGKTTAALGEALRAVGHGLRVGITFFMKGDFPYGEYASLRDLKVDVLAFGLRSLLDPSNIKPEEIEQARLALNAARQAVAGDKYDLVVLDEINVAVAFGLVEADEVVDLVRSKPERLELILTGRYAHRKVLELADLVTEMRNVRHPYDQGVQARKGVEY